LTAAQPEEPVAAERLPGSQRTQDVAGSGGKHVLQELHVRREDRPVPGSVLHDHYEPYGALMLRVEVVALESVSPMLSLEIEDEPIDLAVQDLIRAEEPDVGSLPVYAGRDLQLRPPRPMRDRAQRRRHLELPRVAQLQRRSGIASNDDIDAHGCSHRAKCVELGARISPLDPSHCVWRDIGRSADLEAAQTMRCPRANELASEGLGLVPRP
jgi:hypothetical protein